MAGFEMQRKLPNRIGWVIFSAAFNHKCGRAFRGFAVLGSSNCECRLWLIKSLIGHSGFAPSGRLPQTGYISRQARNWSLIMSVASRFKLLTGALILSGVAYPAFSEDLGY